LTAAPDPADGTQAVSDLALSSAAAVGEAWRSMAPLHGTLYAMGALWLAAYVAHDQFRRFRIGLRRRRIRAEIDSVRPAIEALGAELAGMWYALDYGFGLPRVSFSFVCSFGSVRVTASARSHAAALELAVAEAARQSRILRDEFLAADDDDEEVFAASGAAGPGGGGSQSENVAFDDGRRWWAVLGVDETATRDEVKSAYKKLARLWHPDAHGGADDMMKRVNVARDEAMATFD
jgi:hypothetical protein